MGRGEAMRQQVPSPSLFIALCCAPGLCHRQRRGSNIAAGLVLILLIVVLPVLLLLLLLLSEEILKVFFFQKHMTKLIKQVFSCEVFFSVLLQGYGSNVLPSCVVRVYSTTAYMWTGNGKIGWQKWS